LVWMLEFGWYQGFVCATSERRVVKV